MVQHKERKGSKFFTEIRAGLTTFFTMAYIIAVNVSFPLAEFKQNADLLPKASILSQSGGTCVCKDPNDPTCSTDADYNTCLIGTFFLLRSVNSANE